MQQGARLACASLPTDAAVDHRPYRQFQQPNVNSWLRRRIQIELIMRFDWSGRHLPAPPAEVASTWRRHGPRARFALTNQRAALVGELWRMVLSANLPEHALERQRLHPDRVGIDDEGSSGERDPIGDAGFR